MSDKIIHHTRIHVLLLYGILWDRFLEQGCFFNISINFNILKCPLHNASYTLRIPVSITEL